MRILLVLFISLAWVCDAVADELDRSAPNFVFFLVDDLGWADVACFGSTFHETPNIDRLAASGMKFTNAYAASPVCSPTRASIMTGKHPVRVDITDWIPGNRQRKNPKFAHIDDRDSLALEEVTIAEALKDNGYQTFFAGKWHLGNDGSLPTDQGFDINLGGIEKGSPPGGYYAPFKNRKLVDRKEDNYLTDRLTDESISFLESRKKDQPFLLFLSYYNVHTPIQPYKKRIDHFRAKAKTKFKDKSAPIVEHDGQSRSRQDYPAYASMVAAVDDSVGRILDQLDKLDLSDNTVVCFFSDNGGLCTLHKNRVAPTCNAPLRSGKGWLYEGGIRSPMIVRAPGVTKMDSVCEVPVSSTDFFPTMLELAGLEAKPDLHADGLSLVSLLEESGDLDRDSLYWHYPHYHGSAWTPGAAIRDGDWKLIEFYEYENFELYNLGSDIGEQNNLVDANPEKAKELREKLRSWQIEMNAKMPVLQK